MRLFVALDLPWEVRERLSMLAGGIAGAKWVDPDNYHVTLRFIGETPPHGAEEIDHALANLRARAFDLMLSGIGTFHKGGRTTSLWAGVEKSEKLELLQSKVETALQRAGFERERKRFSPHVTLARTDGAPEAKLAAFVQAHNLFRAGPIPVGHFTLFSSRLGKEQAVYTAEAEYDLA